MHTWVKENPQSSIFLIKNRTKLQLINVISFSPSIFCQIKYFSMLTTTSKFQVLANIALLRSISRDISNSSFQTLETRGCFCSGDAIVLHSLTCPLWVCTGFELFASPPPKGKTGREDNQLHKNRTYSVGEYAKDSRWSAAGPAMERRWTTRISPFGRSSDGVGQKFLDWITKAQGGESTVGQFGLMENTCMKFGTLIMGS